MAKVGKVKVGVMGDDRQQQGSAHRDEGGMVQHDGWWIVGNRRTQHARLLAQYCTMVVDGKQ